jgi:hypothetical protein
MIYMNFKDLPIKDLLKQGLTSDDILNQIEEDIAAALDEIKQEQEEATKNETIELARANVIHAVDEYMVALGISEPFSLTDETFDGMVEILKVLENEIAPVEIKVTKVNTKDKNPDDIIAEFLKSLH